MLNKGRLAVVVPALNEQDNIKKVIGDLLAIGAFPVVVDDGSIDRTAEISTAAGAFVIRHDHKCGYEVALATGIHSADKLGYELVATFDADGQMDAEDLLRLVVVFDANHCDCVIGVRDYRNRYSEYLLALWGMLRFRIMDPLCGMKLYKLDEARKYFPFDSKKMVGMELACRMADAGLKFCQHPIHVKRRVGVSRYGSSLLGEIRILNSLFRVIREFGFFR